jgi:transcriptional regulator with XRE-family HTH domain
MEINLTDEGLLNQIGTRIAGLRLAMNLTQQQLAEQAGIGLRTLQRLEQGEAATQLSSFVRVCRVLGIVERFDALIPELPPSPIAQLRLQGRQRRRATGKKSAARSKTTDARPGKWTWGETP